MQSVETLHQNEVISALWNKNAPEKCRIGLADVVVYERKLPARWYITGKTGEILKKRGLDRKALSERWRRIAVQNNTSMVAIVRQRGNILKILNDDAWIAFCDGMDVIDDTIISVHCFVASNKYTIYRNSYELKDKTGRVTTFTQSYSYTLESDESEAITVFCEDNAKFFECKAHNLRSVMDLATNTVVRYIESMLNAKVLSISIDYVIDAKSQLWMLWTSEAKFVHGNVLADIDIPGFVSGDKSGRMSWAGPKYFEGELDSRVNSAHSITSASRASSSYKLNTESVVTFENSKADALTTSSQVHAATSTILSSSMKNNSKASRREIPSSPRNIFSASEAAVQPSQLQSTFPDPFKCKGDYCNVSLKQAGSLNPDVQLKHHIHEKLFTRKELEILHKDKRFSQMMDFGATNGPALAAITHSSILLARKERKDYSSNKEEEADWKNYPVTPRQQTANQIGSVDDVLAASIYDNSDNGHDKKNDNSLMSVERKVEQEHEHELEVDRIQREAFSKTMANYYDQVRVCATCNKIYMVLDWARTVLEKNKYTAPGSKRASRSKETNLVETYSTENNTTSSLVRSQSTSSIRVQSPPPIADMSVRKRTNTPSKNKDPLSKLEGLGESQLEITRNNKTKQSTWKSYKDKEFTKPKKGERFDTEKFADLDDYLRGGTEALAKRQAKDYERLVQSRINQLHESESADDSRDAEKRAENMYRGKVLLACVEGQPTVDAKVILGSAFFDIRWVPDGRSTINELLAKSSGEEEFDCMLVQRDLPLADAFEITQAYRLHEKTKRRNAAAIAASKGKGEQPYVRRMPIICMTTQTSPKDLQMYMQADMDGCVSLPIQKTALLNTIRAAVPHHLATLVSVGPQKEINSEIPIDPFKKTYKLSAIGTLEGSTDSSTIAGKMMALAGGGTDESTINGVVQIDADTRVPYTVLDYSRNSKMQVSKNRPFFNLVVCHDLFDTAEKMKIFFRPICQKYLGMQILLWNYPGQAFTEWRQEQLLNNEYHSTCLNEVMGQIGQNGTKDFDTTRPFYMMGFGHGTSILSFYSSHYNVPNMRGLIDVNGWSYVDSYLAGVMHDCINVFQSAPANRPDLPVYFFSRFIFSKEYLAKVSVPLALNLYTAVHNPISLSGRISLCKGVLQSVDVRNVLKEIDCPVICIHSTQDSLCRPIHTEPFVVNRGGEVRSIFKALVAPEKTCVIWMKSGHEVFQEIKKQLATLLEQMLIGYHESNDISFPPAPVVDNTLHEASIVSSKEGAKGKSLLSQSIEDKFIDNVLGTLKTVAAVDSSSHRASSAEASINWEDYAVNVAESQLINGSITDDSIKKNRRRKGDKVDLPTFDPTSSLFAKQESILHKNASILKAAAVADYPEVKEYMGWRLKRNRKRLQRLQGAARTIQGAFRAHIARQFVHGIRRRKAAMVIQRSFRGWLGRCKFLNQARRVWAALLIQRSWRGYLGRKWYFFLRLRLAAAATIQKRWRGYQGRQFVKALHRRRHLAACTIQSIFRRNQARRDAWKRRQRRNAATAIQRIFRGHLGKRRASSERDKYIFSKSQSQGIEFGRQMLLEHKLHATKLQSEVTLLTQEKVGAEEQVEALLEEITSFEEGVRILEKEMHELSKVEAEAMAYMDEESKLDLRDQKMRLDREFSDMLNKIGNRKDMLTGLEVKLGSIDKARQRKEEEMRTLERKLVVLLEEQQTELNAIKRKQDVRKALLAASHDQLNAATAPEGGSSALVVRGGGGSSVNSLVSGATSSGPSMQEKKQAAQLMQSTETLMKFGFMSMSMTYFSSLNMIKAMRTVSAQDTVMAALADIDTQKSLSKIDNGGITSGDSKSKQDFLPDLKKGQLPGQEALRVSAWSVEDVSKWLQTLVLGQYVEAFVDAAVDGEFLYDLNDDDLKNTLGVEHRLHRKKILNCVQRLKIAEVQRDARVGSLLREMGNDGPQQLSSEQAYDKYQNNNSNSPVKPTRGEFDSEFSVSDAKEDRRSIDGPSIGLEELFSLVRHSKFSLLKEALDYLPDKSFDKSLVRQQYMSDEGTIYHDGYNRLRFHTNKIDDHGNTMLMLAAQNGNVKVAKYLVTKGANMDHQNFMGQSAAHFAIAYQFFELSQWLFSAGASDTLENMHGLSPYDGLSPE